MPRNNPKATFEICLKDSKPFAKMVITNKPIWTTGLDGTPRHGTISQELMEAVHGEGCADLLAGVAESLGEDGSTVFSNESSGWQLKDFEADLVLRTCQTDRVTDDAALEMMKPPSEEEIADYISRAVLPEGFDEEFTATYGMDPTPADQAATLKALATCTALDKGNHQLMGLPENVLDEIKAGLFDIYVVGPLSDGSRSRFSPKSIAVRDLIGVAYHFDASKTVWHLHDRYSDGAARGLIPTAMSEADDSCRWICYVERPGAQRGLIIAFPRELVDDVLVTKHEWIFRIFPRLLLEDMYPPCRWQPPRPRAKRSFRERRNPYAPAPPRKEPGTAGSKPQATEGQTLPETETDSDDEALGEPDATDSDEGTESDDEAAPQQAEGQPPSDGEPASDDEAAGEPDATAPKA
ncbi:hypothetical protein KJ781_01435 [Patescibacteria group bacterium]|nr:hypothetical protein [Patescibacteria group bacterium]MBU1448931.1 hypothetical protein [Patescibacteria group bacterium]MBU2613156.1 hypothetical protein [Patescibacteria group bacterium]